MAKCCESPGSPRLPQSYGGVLREPRAWEFEVSFARFHGAGHGIAVTNGTAAFEVAMTALGLSSGDEVMVPNFTFVVNVSSCLQTPFL